MQFDEIIKDTNYSDSNKPNLLDYKKQYENFDWYRDAFSKLDWLPDGGLNNAYECVDRHVKNGFGDKLALVWLGKNGEEENRCIAGLLFKFTHIKILRSSQTNLVK